MGYGFCMAQNPWDRFALAFKPPPASVQSKLRITHPELFDLDGWDSLAGTFYLPSPRYLAQSYHHAVCSFWNALPPTLVELLFYMIMRERGNDVSPTNLDQHFVNNKACSDIFAISRHLLEQIQPMHARIVLDRNNLPDKPKNKLQANAQIYRDGQIRILEVVIRELSILVHSIRPSAGFLREPSKHSVCSILLDLPKALEIWSRAFPSEQQRFLSGIGQTTNSTDVHDLLRAGWEEDIWTLWLCWLLLMDKNGDFAPPGTSGDDSDDKTQMKRLVGGWTDWLRESYLPGILERVRRGTLRSTDPRTRFEALRDVDLGNDRDMAETALSDLEDHLNDLMSIVRTAATSAPNSLWGDGMWTADLIAVWGLRITKYECFEKSLLQGEISDSNTDGDLVMYLHRPEGRHIWLEAGHEP